MSPPVPDQPRRLVYLGTPELAVAPLRALVAAGYEVPLVVSAPDRRRGRGGTTTPSPVKSAALELGLPDTDDPDAVLDVDVDLGVVVAYGRLLRPHLLERIPFVNLHVSLLPRWRGAAPIERAILAGDETTGVCLMAVEEGLDTGGVYARSATVVDRKTVADLRTELMQKGTDLLLDALANGFGPPEPQVGEVTYAEKLTAAEHELDWAAAAEDVDRRVRVGGAWTTVDGKRLKVHEVEPVDAAGDTPDEAGATDAPGALRGLHVRCGSGTVRLIEVQPEGRPRMSATAWQNGAGASARRLGT